MGKIIFKVPEFPHISETFIVAQIVTAVKLGYDVQILVRKKIDYQLDLSNSLIDEYNLLDKVILEDYKMPSNKVFILLRWFQILILNLSDIKFILKYYKEQSKFSLTPLFEWFFYKELNTIAVFHVQYGTNKSPLDILKKIGFLKPKLIVTFHGHDAFFPINGFIPNNGYYNNLFQYGDLITANTPYLGDKLLDLGCPIEKLELIPVGVDTDFFYPKENINQSLEDLKLISVGRLDKMKGHIYCVEVVNELIKRGVNVTLTIIGEGAERHNLQADIKKYNLENRVFLMGAKSQEEIRQALWDHDLYLLLAVPTEDGRRETQGLATLEAQACGLPVVAFDSGGVKYTIDVGHTGFISQEYDVKDLVSKLENLYNDKILLKRMSDHTSYFIKENYSQSMILRKWSMIYKEIII